MTFTAIPLQSTFSQLDEPLGNQHIAENNSIWITNDAVGMRMEHAPFGKRKNDSRLCCRIRNRLVVA